MKTIELLTVVGLSIDDHIKRVQKNSVRVKGEDWPCPLCGKPVNPNTAKHWIHLVEGGGKLGHIEETNFEECADLGWHPVGSDCAKKVPKGYKSSDSKLSLA